MDREFAVMAETKEGKNVLLRRGFTSRGDAETHPVRMVHWNKVWIDEVTPRPAPRRTLPPTPWSLETSALPSANGMFHAYIVDATGRKIMALWGSSQEKLLVAEAILNAVNSPLAMTSAVR